MIFLRSLIRSRIYASFFGSCKFHPCWRLYDDCVKLQIPGCFYCFILFKNFWCQDNLICRNSFYTQDRQDIFSVLKCKDIIRTFITMSWSCIGIGMAHHEIYLFLRILPYVAFHGCSHSYLFVRVHLDHNKTDVFYGSPVYQIRFLLG